MPTTSAPVQNNEEILKLIEKFGFKFFGYDESNNVLVVAPNGQIVPLNVAYNFVRTQIEKSSNRSGGPETMPQIPSMPVIPDGSMDKGLETEKGIETQRNQSNVAKTSNLSPIAVPNNAPKVKAMPVEAESPYGDGFTVKVNPKDIDKAMDFIKKNSNKSNTDTSKWLAVQFEKFIEEQKLAA